MGSDEEAPPCMRWRGLARSHSPARRSLSCRLPGCCPLPTGPLAPIPAGNSGFPDSPCVPGSPPELRGLPPERYPREVVSAFLLRGRGPAQELSASNLKILWPSTGHLPLSPAYPVHPPFIHRSVHRWIRSQAVGSCG